MYGQNITIKNDIKKAIARTTVIAITMINPSILSISLASINTNDYLYYSLE